MAATHHGTLFDSSPIASIDAQTTHIHTHTGKGHGGQRRAFKVRFLGEGVNDYGGPYRAVFEQVRAFLRFVLRVCI